MNHGANDDTAAACIQHTTVSHYSLNNVLSKCDLSFAALMIEWKLPRIYYHSLAITASKNMQYALIESAVHKKCQYVPSHVQWVYMYIKPL